MAQGPGSVIRVEEDRLLKLLRVVGWLAIPVVLCAAVALLLAASGHPQDWGAVAAAAALILLVCLAILLIVGFGIYHLFAMFRLLVGTPIGLVRDLVEAAEENRSDSPVASPAITEAGRRSRRSLYFAMPGLFFPFLGPVAMWYAWGVLRVDRSACPERFRRLARWGFGLGLFETSIIVFVWAAMAVVAARPR